MRIRRWTVLASFLVLTYAQVARADGAPSGVAPEGKTGWAVPGSAVGITLGAGVLGMAIASDVVQSGHGDGTSLGAAAVLTTLVALPVVALSRRSTDGRGSPALRIVGYTSVCVGLGIGGFLLGTSLSNGANYPPGLVTAVGASAALGITLLSVETLMARGDVLRDNGGRPRALALGIPIISVVPNAAGGFDGAIGFARTF